MASLSSHISLQPSEIVYAYGCDILVQSYVVQRVCEDVTDAFFVSEHSQHLVSVDKGHEQHWRMIRGPCETFGVHHSHGLHTQTNS